MAMLGVLASAAAGLAVVVWPAGEAETLEHDHPDLPSDHPHLREHLAVGKRHRHAFVIDDEHRAWPVHGRLAGRT